MATRTGLLLTKTVRGNARSLGKVDGNKLLSVVLEGLKNSPQLFKMPFRCQHLTTKTWRFLDKHLGEQGLERRLVCLFAEEYSQLFLEFFRPSRTTWRRQQLVADTVSCSWSSSDLLGLQTTTCCHRLFQAIARYRAQFW